MELGRLQQVLGLPGAWVGQEDPADHYATRVGGLPHFPGTASPVEYQPPVCGVCGGPLSLVHQAYAPLDGGQAGRQLVNRFLLVFGCSQPGCSWTAAAWRALRCQRAASPPQLADGSAVGTDAISRTADAQPQVPHPVPRPSEWGGAQDDWGSGFNASLQTSSGATAAFQFADLDAALDKVGATSAPTTSAILSQQQPASVPAGSQASEQPLSACTSCTAAAGPDLPAFYLHAAPEPARAADQRLQPEHAAHVAELLRRYKAEEGQVPDAASVQGGEWAGEAYEPDSTRTADAAFLKFTRRLQRCPEQCVRYGFGADMLWPAAGRPQPQPCPRCGGPRVPELQLMPGLLAALGDGLAWQAEHADAEAGGRATVAAPSVDNWAWLTLAVFTCKASCGQSDGWCVAEEQIASCQEQ